MKGIQLRFNQIELNCIRYFLEKGESVSTICKILEIHNPIEIQWLVYLEKRFNAIENNDYLIQQLCITCGNLSSPDIVKLKNQKIEYKQYITENLDRELLNDIELEN